MQMRIKIIYAFRKVFILNERNMVALEEGNELMETLENLNERVIHVASVEINVSLFYGEWGYTSLLIHVYPRLHRRK